MASVPLGGWSRNHDHEKGHVMTNTRLAYNGLRTTLAVALTAGATAVTFATPLTHSGGVNVPTLAGGDYLPLAILDPVSGALTEIVKLTAYTAGATTGTIVRGQSGTTAIAHAVGGVVVRAPLVADFGQWATWVPTVTSATGAITTKSVAGAQYLEVGELVMFSLNIIITTAGTGAGGLNFTPPTDIHADSASMGTGREYQATGLMCTIIRSSAVVASVLRYDNVTVIASGRSVALSGFYRRA